MLPLVNCIVQLPKLSHPCWYSGLLPSKVMSPTVFSFPQHPEVRPPNTLFPKILGIISIQKIPPNQFSFQPVVVSGADRHIGLNKQAYRLVYVQVVLVKNSIIDFKLLELNLLPCLT